MKVSVSSIDVSPIKSPPKQRSVLEWKIALPFMWIEAAAKDEAAKTILSKAMTARQKREYGA